MSRSVRLLTTGTALILAVQLAPAAVASEATETFACGVTARNRDSGPYGQYFLQNVNLRNGPEWRCDVKYTATPVNKVDYYCTTDGFTYLRTASTKYGWVHNSYLKGGGSTIPC
ncbi:SH3 domain-containing protein [Streptomyces sp. AV19]|uniref:SH3 domain-containing protein n=1 Tax=Streptomyces sp. AV19 TaxID=2793068 RepID=UPI0018FEC0BC|nr:SH3 domain-containing protein [Streptomyces sp. AV19]MBH1937705.1 SH3 domain-containing protein [Streptomyces sp. AV19]MDG4536373.1 SH3 domain-containing protein [Streptomyces sp. AV19]